MWTREGASGGSLWCGVDPNASEAPVRRGCPWASLPSEAMPNIRWRAPVEATGSREVLRSYPGRSLGLRELAVAAEDERTERRRAERSRMVA
jgi:hypothetical protein